MSERLTSVFAKLVAACAAISVAGAAHGQAVMYVDDDAPGGGDGSSWQLAFGDLQDALAAALGAQTYEIRIAQGLYLPDGNTGDRLASFDLDSFSGLSASVLTIRGGFRGLGGGDPDEHDPDRFVTMLSGDLNGDDVPGFGNRGENSLHVVMMNGLGEGFYGPTLADLTIRGGNADGVDLDGWGGGVRVRGGGGRTVALILDNCKLLDNMAVRGGGLHISGGDVVIEGSLLEGNRAQFGGAATAELEWFVGRGFLTLVDCVVADNEAVDGGGIYDGLGGNVFVRRSTLGGNVATNSGGAIAYKGSLRLKSSLLVGNSAGQLGGATVSLLNSANGMSMMTSTIVNNTANIGGAFGFEWGGSTTQITDSIVWGNRAQDQGDHVYISTHNGPLEIAFSVMEGGRGGIFDEGSIVNLWGSSFDADPLFVDPAGPDGDPATWRDNDYSLGDESPCLDAGTNRVAASYELDILGNPRRQNAKCSSSVYVDIGAYEHVGGDCPPLLDRVYVNALAPSGGDGLSWDTAFDDLRDAMYGPAANQIWVAAGTYRCDGGVDDPMMALEINSDIAIYGGFAGFEKNLSERDWEVNRTVVEGAGGERWATQFVWIIESGDIAIDGFEIRNVTDNWRSDGSAIWAQTAALQLRNCTFTQCITGREGGALRSYDSDIAIVNCEFIECSGWNTIHSERSTINFEDSRLEGNRAGPSWHRGGNIWLLDSSLAAIDSEFRDNISDESGGVIASFYSDVDLVRSQFVNNISLEKGGAIFFLSEWAESDFRASHSTFTGNSAQDSGGAIEFSGAEIIEIVNCLFNGNTVWGAFDVGAAAFRIPSGQSRDGYAIVANSTIVGNHALSDTGDYATAAASIPINNKVHVSNSIFWWNSRGDDLSESAQLSVRGQSGDVPIHGCSIQGWTWSIPAEFTDARVPRFIDRFGVDGIAGTEDDDLHLLGSSACVESGLNELLPDDFFDLDGDGDVNEPIPFDLDGLERVYAENVDLGAYESQVDHCLGDFNGDSVLNINDFLAFLNAYSAGEYIADFNGDAALNTNDFLAFFNAFSSGCP